MGPDVNGDAASDAPVRLEATDSRRLTGPNLLLDGAGAILQVTVEGVEVDAAVRAWQRRVERLLAAVGWGDATVASRAHRGGASLAFTAPIDALYAATSVNEAAWDAAVAELTGADSEHPDLAATDRRTDAGDAEVARLGREIDAERDPRRLALREAAADHGVAFLWDDDEVSVGVGAGSLSWPAGDLPAPAAVDWGRCHDVPVALVTGTNGKSTTVRMLAAILAASGTTAGLTSTDGIVVGSETVAEGDWSGPGGARALLRDRRVGAAALEVARGGILRRGLPVEQADVAVVTNVAADHLGEYGIATVSELAQAKLVVAKAVRRTGTLVVNADNAPVVEALATAGAALPPDRTSTPPHASPAADLAWFSLDADAPPLRERVVAGGRGWTVADGAIVEVTRAGHARIVAVEAIPATYGGSARHNIENALAAAAAARVLGVEPRTVAAALAAFTATVADNPGRTNVFDLDGATVIVDFAHNPHGMEAIAAMVEALPARRRVVLFGQAGDRGDDDIRALARRVRVLEPARVVAVEIPTYRRGRDEFEVPELIRGELVAAGLDPDAVIVAPTPLDGVRRAVEIARAGDVLMLMVLDQREAAVELLMTRGAVPRNS